MSKTNRNSKKRKLGLLEKFGFWIAGQALVGWMGLGSFHIVVLLFLKYVIGREWDPYILGETPSFSAYCGLVLWL